jgi:hypothetical protein
MNESEEGKIKTGVGKYPDGIPGYGETGSTSLFQHLPRKTFFMKYLFIIVVSSFLIYTNTDDKPGSFLENEKNRRDNSALVKNEYYTHALWMVKAGKLEAFLEAWQDLILRLPREPNSGTAQLTLIQSLADPRIFYSFGPWGGMGNDSNSKKAISELQSFCQETRQATFKTIME